MQVIEVIKLAILKAGATECYVKFNNSCLSLRDEGCEPEDDLPEPKSLSLFIAGGNPVDVAKAIYACIPLGISTNGDFSVQIEGYANIRWYNLTFESYIEQRKEEQKVSKILEKEYLTRRLAELEEIE